MRLKDIKQRKRSPEQLAEPLRRRLLQVLASTHRLVFPASAAAPIKPIQVSIQGQRDRRARSALATGSGRDACKIRGLVDLDTSLKAARPTLDVKLNRGLASDLGVSLQQVSDALGPLLTGEDISTWKAPDGKAMPSMSACRSAAGPRVRTSLACSSPASRPTRMAARGWSPSRRLPSWCPALGHPRSTGATSSARCC